MGKKCIGLARGESRTRKYFAQKRNTVVLLEATVCQGGGGGGRERERNTYHNGNRRRFCRQGARTLWCLQCCDAIDSDNCKKVGTREACDWIARMLLWLQQRCVTASV
jgi:hypothetical protein